MLIDREAGSGERRRDAIKHYSVRTHGGRAPEHPGGIDDSQRERSLWEGDELDLSVVPRSEHGQPAVIKITARQRVRISKSDQGYSEYVRHSRCSRREWSVVSRQSSVPAIDNVHP